MKSLEEYRRENEAAHARWLAEQPAKVETVPGKNGGNPHVAGGRVNVAVIADALRHGYTADRIAEMFDTIRRDHVVVAVWFAAQYIPKYKRLWKDWFATYGADVRSHGNTVPLPGEEA